MATGIMSKNFQMQLSGGLLITVGFFIAIFAFKKFRKLVRGKIWWSNFWGWVGIILIFVGVIMITHTSTLMSKT
jgi:hypothetical protein